MYISYDVVKIILEIKYKNWLNEKKCICGNHDFKECDFVGCSCCSNNYCENQEGLDNWLWECQDCSYHYCGEHLFHINDDYQKICLKCNGRPVTKKAKYRLETVPEAHLLPIEGDCRHLCICGNLDYTECSFVECSTCPNTYCENQEGIDIWLWECEKCIRYFCGDHTIYINEDRRRICSSCAGEIYEMPEKLHVPPNEKDVISYDK